MRTSAAAMVHIIGTIQQLLVFLDLIHTVPTVGTPLLKMQICLCMRRVVSPF
jgi:hypothetical protein